ncbi:hypothetical protein DM860_015938 [Cuscuta australis]|uniref:Uncharacterized protein n=1 Tax=Cuscuta australis TaxID=267555 RepID=A0A328E2Z7_9ASTE|nr:hypothetical protein DM860_015938 [Cuscuta australis]
MATLQKFKLFATQCAVAGSPTRSPTTSPVIHFRRRKTLGMLLSLGADHGSPDLRREAKAEEKEMAARRKLKDLFVSSSSPPPPQPPCDNMSENLREELLSAAFYGDGGLGGGGSSIKRVGSRPLSATFRQRLLRRSWRPVLIAIPE